MVKGKELELSKPEKRKSTTGEEVKKEAKKRLFKAWGKLLPYGAQVVASAAAYTMGVTATQLVGFVCKVSCATPVLGPCMGFLGVGIASALAGQASKHTHKMVSTGASPLKKGFWEPIDMDDVVLDAVLGIFMFKAIGGRFCSLMPSDLAKPGALAFESIPARPSSSESYAPLSVKRELARIFKRDGCHHCGSHRGPVIGDHMPPNKVLAVSKNEKLRTAVGELPGIAKVRELIGLAGRTGHPLQRFYPQCQRCSVKQATAMRNGKRVLVLHLHGPRYRSEHLAGVFVGIRHSVPPVQFPEHPSRPLALIPPVSGTTAEDSRGTRHRNSSSSSSAAPLLPPPQMNVQELVPGWEMQPGGGYMPAGAMFAQRAGTESNGQHQQQYVRNSGGRSRHHHSGSQKHERQSGPQGPPGSLGLVQQQLGDVLQQQDRVDGTSLLVPEAAKQRADAAFERFTPGLAR